MPKKTASSPKKVKKPAQKEMQLSDLSEEKDVRKWFRELLNVHSLNFHPDTPFGDYVELGTGGKTLFAKTKAAYLDRMMGKAFKICAPKGEDRIYQLATQEFDKYSKKAK